MSGKSKSFSGKSEAGNAIIYVLVVIALFAALTFVIARKSGSTQQAVIPEEKLNVYATQIIQVSNQVKQAVDQMVFSGSSLDALQFCLPADACFNVGSSIHKIFHSDGGGVIMPKLMAEAVGQVDTNPAAGWYLGRFNNVGWTATTATDIIMVAHQIREPVCARINELLTGSAAIPALNVNINKVLISATDADGNVQHTNSPTADFDATVCPGCNGRPSLCVENSTGTAWSYYNILEQR